MKLAVLPGAVVTLIFTVQLKVLRWNNCRGMPVC